MIACRYAEELLKQLNVLDTEFAMIILQKRAGEKPQH
jgi:hypothetical protein